MQNDRESLMKSGERYQASWGPAGGIHISQEVSEEEPLSAESRACKVLGATQDSVYEH